MATKSPAADPEIAAISEVYSALLGLETDAQARILKYVADKLKLPVSPIPVEPIVRTDFTDESHNEHEITEHLDSKEEVSQELEGISPGGKKWITRSGIHPTQLAQIFSIGGDEIDLIANSVPGASKAKRMRSVILLKGVAAYLSTGAARLTDQAIRETCLHYDALDVGNFATHIKALISEVTGSKETGYTLSPRGLANATEIVKAMIAGKSD